eukprot:scaffold10528_cov129-Isochrysis_galbana.AAC.1
MPNTRVPTNAAPPIGVLPAVEGRRDHRGGRPDAHAPPWGRALGIAQTPLQWNGQGRFVD